MGRSRRGGAPGMDTTLSPPHGGRAWRRRGGACTGAAACGRESSMVAASAISPAYMTAARSQTCATIGRSWVTSMSARLKSSASETSSSRICACTITSSAVVGSSARRIFGLARERHRDRGSLPHPARELVRIAVGPVLRDADPLEQFLRPAAMQPSLRGAVEVHRLRDLRADGLHGVEGVHGALEDHRDVVPAVRAHRLLPPGQDVLAVQHALLPRRSRSGAGGP